jgi:hypothetical protein
VPSLRRGLGGTLFNWITRQIKVALKIPIAKKPLNPGHASEGIFIYPQPEIRSHEDFELGT